MSLYAVPIQPMLFDVGTPAEKIIIPRRELERRLEALRRLKLDLEKSVDDKRKTIRELKDDLESVSKVLNKESDVHRMLLKKTQECRRARLRIKELCAKVDQVYADRKILQNTVDKFRDQLFCIKCEQTKSYKCFPRNVKKLIGRDNRCNICQREKTIQWRAAKKVASEPSD